jgi:hypothetical protein
LTVGVVVPLVALPLPVLAVLEPVASVAEVVPPAVVRELPWPTAPVVVAPLADVVVATVFPHAATRTPRTATTTTAAAISIDIRERWEREAGERVDLRESRCFMGIPPEKASKTLRRRIIPVGV